MNEIDFGVTVNAHSKSEKFSTLLEWLNDNSSALRRERTSPVPEVIELLHFARRLERVTTREFQVFEQVIEGLTAVQIGERLNISPRTVDVHKSRFIQKMEIGNMVVAARYFSILETLMATDSAAVEYAKTATAS
jgi:DNA-binding NarL/FixJ family response regulator